MNTEERNDGRRAQELERRRDPPTGRAFEVDFYSVAWWDDGRIVEENPMYDLVTFMKQLGPGG